MWSVDEPQFCATETFQQCIARIRDRDLKGRLERLSGEISGSAADYEERAQRAELHLVNPAANVAGIVTTDEMVRVYDQRMAGKNGPGRHIYDSIKLLPRHGICPFCDHRPVSTLDHVLPKRRYPSLAVAPANLVGACADCNKAKLDFVPNNGNEVVLHPYFDNVMGERWLHARIIEGPIAAVIFSVQEVDAWPNELNERVQRQFNMLGLAPLYGAQAAREISAQSILLQTIHQSRGAAGVREELLLQADSRDAVRLNSWQAVASRALSENNWYCEGGFRGV